MRQLVLIASVVAVLAGVSCSGSHAARQFCDPGSFLATKVDSVDALVKQITTNPTVTKRYARLYRTSTGEVISHFQSADIKIVALTKPMKTTVYYVGEKSGKIRGKSKVMPAGAKIFMAPNGTPLMDVKCGNPFRRELIKEQPAPKKPVEKVKAIPPAEEKFTPQAAVTPPPVGTAPPVQMAFVPPVQQSLAVAPIARPTIPVAARVAGPALIALGGVHASGGGGAVPEPGTILAALSILVPAGVLFRRRGM